MKQSRSCEKATMPQVPPTKTNFNSSMKNLTEEFKRGNENINGQKKALLGEKSGSFREPKPKFSKSPDLHSVHTAQNADTLNSHEDMRDSAANLRQSWRSNQSSNKSFSASIKGLTKELQTGPDFLHLVDEPDHRRKSKGQQQHSPHRTPVPAPPGAASPLLRRTPSVSRPTAQPREGSLEPSPAVPSSFRAESSAGGAAAVDRRAGLQQHHHTKSFRGGNIAELTRELRGTDGGREQTLRELRSQLVHPPAAAASAATATRKASSPDGAPAAERRQQRSPMLQSTGAASSPEPESEDGSPRSRPRRSSPPRLTPTSPSAVGGVSRTASFGKGGPPGAYRKTESFLSRSRSEEPSGPPADDAGTGTPDRLSRSGGSSLAARVKRALVRSLQCLPLSA